MADTDTIQGGNSNLLEKLNGQSNYSIWADKIELYLMGQELQMVVSGEQQNSETRISVEIKALDSAATTPATTATTSATAPQPKKKGRPPNASRATISALLPPVTVENIEQLTPIEFNKRNQRACYIIASRVSNQVYLLIRGIRLAKLIWERLQNSYAKHSFNYKAQLITQLYILKSDDFRSTQKYINAHLDIIQKLEDLGGYTLKESSPAAFLNNLDSQFNTQVVTTRSRARKEGTPNITDVASELIDEERLIIKPETALTINKTNKKGRNKENKDNKQNKENK